MSNKLEICSDSSAFPPYRTRAENKAQKFKINGQKVFQK